MVCGISSVAQDGKLVIHVTPKQAYVFADGRAISEASKLHSLSLSAGDHKIELANYGYAPSTQTVTITAGKTTNLDVTLAPVTGTVSRPFGAMTIEGAARDAILLNGKTPDFFVGHGDEFDHDWWWKQELVVSFLGDFELPMGLRPTHIGMKARSEGSLIPNRLRRDFRRSLMGIFHQLRRGTITQTSNPWTKTWGWAKVVFHSTDAIEVTDTAGDGKHELARLTGHYESKSPPFFLSNIEQPR